MTQSALPSVHTNAPHPAVRRRIVVFDVNETLLDVGALRPHFARIFGNADVVREWFSTLLRYSHVATAAGPYMEFGVIAGGALEMVASARSVALSPQDRAAVLDGMRSMPPHADVRAGLECLRTAGFRVVALTNNAPAMVEHQMQHAKLTDLFERLFSVDAVKRFKPSPEPYQHVARTLGVETSDLRMVAAHAWDVMGAVRAGCAGAFIARPGQVWYPLSPQPDIVGPDLNVVAQRIIDVDRGHA